MNNHLKEQIITAFYLFQSLFFLSVGIHSLLKNDHLSSLMLIGGGILFFLSFSGRSKKKRQDRHTRESTELYSSKLIFFACYLPSFVFMAIGFIQYSKQDALWSILMSGCGALYLFICRKEIFRTKHL